LELHPDKTGLFEFGRVATENRSRRRDKKPETFDFLGFTHSCSVARSTRKFKLLRKTISKRWKAKNVSLYKEMRKRINWSIEEIEEVGEWLRRTVRGCFNYFAIPDNTDTLWAFRFTFAKLWLKIIRRRSHKARMTWEKFKPIIEKWLPKPVVVHTYLSQRLALRSN
jgi:hypothetical protein